MTSMLPVTAQPNWNLTAAPDAGTSLSESIVRDFVARVRGEVVLPGDAAYDTARRVWNKEFVRQPALVVRAADAADVARTIAFARENDLALAIRSGGHSLAGLSSVDDGVILDLSLMKGVEIDPERRIAWVQPGVTSVELALLAAQYDLGLTTGDAPTVGIGGLTLGGGVGFMVRKYGLTIDHLISAEVVTANGQIVTASETEHPDLFWALRGGGGNFGVVTRFQFRLDPVGTILGGPIVYPATAEVVHAYTQRALEAPEGLTTITFILPAPPLPFIPEELVGKPALLIFAVFVGDHEEGHRALEPLRTLGPGVIDLTGPMPYPAIFDLTKDPTVSSHHAGHTVFLEEFPKELVDTVVDFIANPTSPLSLAQIRPLGGAFARVAADATASAHRDKSFQLAIINDWDGPGAEDSAPHRAWTDAFWEQVRPYGTGVYVNFIEAGEDRVHEAYPTATYERLAAVKRQYDPTNFFQLNQNVQARAVVLNQQSSCAPHVGGPAWGASTGSIVGKQ